METTGEKLRAKQMGRMEVMFGLKSGNIEKAKAEYERTIKWAVMMGLGGKLHCNAIDPDFFGMFSDWYKSDVGFRPSGAGWTYNRCTEHWKFHAEGGEMKVA